MPESPQLCLLAAGSPFAFTEVHDTIFYFWVADMRVDITMNTGLEVRKIHLRVTLKKITMNIKFPCSLTAQIKHDTTLDSKKLFELKNGECSMTEALEFDCQAQFNPAKQRFEDKKITINVFMVSMSGKVAAGSANFSLFGKEPDSVNECVQFLEKCPDKQAKIYFSFSFQAMGKNERLDKTYFSEFRSEQNRKKESFNSVYLANAARTPKVEQRSIRQAKSRRSPSPINTGLNESIVEGVIALDKNLFPTDNRNQRRTTEYAMNQQLRVPLTSKLRDYSKHGMRQNLSNKSFNFGQKIDTQRFQTQPIEDEDKEEVQRLRLKVLNLQRSDKGATQLLRETKEEGERRKNKISQLEVAKFELEEALRSKEQKLKKVEKLLKDTNQQKEDVENQFKSIKTQFELRESINREQLKKWEQRYKQSEAERQQITEEYNRALKTFEEGEKKYQVLLKEKERAGLEEKAKINKKLEQKIAAFEELEREKKELKMQVEDLIKEKRQLYDAFSGGQISISNANATIEALDAKLKGQAGKIRQYEEQLESLKKSEAEKQQLKKKVHQLTVTNTSLNQKLQKYEKTIDSLEVKIRVIEQQLDRKNNEKLQLSSKLNQLKKDFDSLRLQQQKNVKQSQSLACMHDAANAKIADLRSKLQLEKRDHEEAHRQFSSRYSVISREKQSLFAEAEELRWELDKQVVTVNELSIQVRAQNDDIFRLNEELLEKGERIKKLEENLKQLTISYDHLNNNYTDAEQKRRQLQGYCKEKDNEYAELKKKSERLERELLDWKERVRVNEISTKQRIGEIEKKLKEKQDAVQTKLSQLQAAQMQIRSLQDECSSQKQQNLTAQQEVSHLKDIIASNRRELESQEAMILKLKDGQAELKKTVNDQSAQISQQHGLIATYTKKIEKMSEEYLSHKSNSLSALESFMNDLIRDEEVNNVAAQTVRSKHGLYPDERIAALQIQYIQKHWQNSSKQRSKVAQLTQDKETLQNEINRLTTRLQNALKKHQSELLLERQKIKNFYMEVSKKEEGEKQRSNRHEEVLNLKQRELQQAKSQIMKLEEEIQQLQSQIKVMISQYDSLKNEHRELEDTLFKVKSQEIKERADLEAKGKQTTEFLEQKIQRLRQGQTEYESKIVHLEKDLVEKGELIKKYQLEMNVLIYERDTKQSKANELGYRLEEYQSQLKDYERQIREKDREIKRAMEANDQISTRLREEKEKLQQALYKVQEQNQIILQLHQEIEKTNQDLSSEQQKLMESEGQTKNKLESSKLLCDKQAQEIKELKQKNIALSSQLDLKKFVLAQLEHANKTEISSKEQLRSELEKKKNTVIQLTEQNAILTLKIRQAEEQQSTIASENDAMSIAVERLKQSINQMRASARDDQQVSEQALRYEKDVERIKQQKVEQEHFYERTIQELTNSLRQAKRLENSRQWKEEELKRKLKTVEKLLQAMQKNRIYKEVQRERRDLVARNQSLEARVDHLEDELAATKLRSRRQTEKYAAQLESLKDEANTKDFIIRNQQMELDNLTYKLNELQSQRSRLEGEIERERTKSRKLQGDLQSQQKLSKEKLKKIQEESIRSIVEEVQKRMVFSRSQRLEGNFNELQRVVVAGSYRQVEEILRSVAKEKRF